jgi:phosphoglycerol transferase MdoB-like AlkP superfamily enzyme
MLIMCIEGINYAQGNSIIHFTESTTVDESPIVERYGTLVNNVVGLLGNKAYEELTQNLNKSKCISSEAENKDTPNFVIVQVESMDSNLINMQYKNQYITPFLHSLSQKSVYYPYVLSYHMGGGTSDAEFSMINSIEPLGNYPAIKIENFDYSNSLIKSLSESSKYHSVAFHGNSGDFYNRNVAFPSMGFDQFFDLEKMNMTDTGWGAPDNEVLNYTANYINRINQPFISYTITMTSHTPFINAKNYYNNSLYDSIEDETVKNFFNSFSYVDKSIEDFILKVRSEHKNTFIFIIGDHTPSVNNEFYKQASFITDNKYFEFVPLFIITPDDKVYKEEKSVASFLDISPTILYTSGIKFDIKSNGRNLLNPGISTNADLIPFKGSL